MAVLFEIEGTLVTPNAETLLIAPFSEIWARDKSKKKEFALEDFAYMEFMTSMMKSNPYRQYPESRKHEVISDAVITRADWEPDELIAQGMKKIVVFQKEASTTYSYYLAAKYAAENMKEFFMTVDIQEKNFKSGNPIYKPRDITAALNDTEKVLGNMKALEKKVEEELFDDVKNRADKMVSPFANPDSLD